MSRRSCPTPRRADLTGHSRGSRAWRSTAFALAGTVVTALAFIAQRILRIEEAPACLPAPAISADSAGGVVERFAQSSGSARSAACELAPSTAAVIDPFVEGSEFYPRMLDDLAEASSIHILMFGWKPGVWGQRFADTVAARLAAGAEVRIVVDSFGSRPYGSSSKMFQQLVDAGAEMVVNDLLPPVRHGRYPSASMSRHQLDIGRSDHRKLLVIDRAVMWTGGAGIEDHFENGEFHDVMVRLTGDVVVQAQAVFAMAFIGNGGSAESVEDWFVQPQDPGSIPTTIGQVIPGGCVTATHAARSLIERADQRLDIVNPYLTDDAIIDDLIDAALRDVRVRVVVSERSNNALASAALRHHYERMLNAGIEIWHYPDAVVHAKVIVADDSVQFGTLNLDAWALYRNFELAVVAHDAVTAQRFVEALIGPAVARSERVTNASGGTARLVESIASRLAYLL